MESVSIGQDRLGLRLLPIAGWAEERTRFQLPRNCLTGFFVIWPVLLLTLLLGGSSHTQAAVPTPPIIDPTGRSGEPPRPREEELEPPRVAPGIVLPPAPLPPKEKAGIPPFRVFVREIRLTGSTSFPPKNWLWLRLRIKIEN